MSSKTPPDNRVPFSNKALSKDFGQGISKFLRDYLDESMKHMVSPANVLQLHHGRTWTHSGAPDDSPSEMKIHTATHELSRAQISSNDISAFRDFLLSMADQFKSELQQNLYSTVSESSEKIGNVVSATKEGSFPKAFLAMLKKIEFGVDSNGNVSLPSLHVGPGQAERMIAELEAQGEEFRAEVQSIQREKAAAAAAREQERLGRYKR